LIRRRRGRKAQAAILTARVTELNKEQTMNATTTPRTIEQIQTDLHDAKTRVTMYETGVSNDPTAWDDLERYSEELEEAEGRKVGTDHGACHACPMDGRLLTDTDGSVRCDACGHIAF
jgi:hypothetical protein